jgi:ParB family transcriptional regulator, chromosome partitioning protein
MSIDFDALSLDQMPGAVPGRANGAASTHLGTPLMLPLDSIDEDPSQPRREFDTDGLQQLADTIAQRGVRQPISVRIHPSQPDRWIVNFGARRLRASKLAGKTDIPAFVDNTANTYDQVIENEQREGLKPLELALFVQQRLALGESQADIARLLGKSRPYVTYATALIDAPDWLMATYRAGRCRGSRELHELRGLHAEHTTVAEVLLNSGQLITRERIAEAKARVNVVVHTAAMAFGDGQTGGGFIASSSLEGAMKSMPTGRSPSAESAHSFTPSQAPEPQRQQLVLLGEVEDQTVEIVLNQSPQLEGSVCVQAASGADIFEVRIDQVRFLRLTARSARSTL